MEKSTYTTILHEKRIALSLSLSEYCVADSVHKLSNNSKYLWCKNPVENISKFLGLSERQLVRILQQLIELDFIERMPGSKNNNNVRTTEKWVEEVVLYNSVKSMSKGDILSSKGDKASSTRVRIIKNSNKITNKEKDSSTAVVSGSIKTESFDFPAYVEIMREDKQRHIQLIGNYFKRRKLSFDSKEKTAAAIKRHLRAAKSLEPFSKSEIRAAVHVCDEKYYDIDWTLDTVLKVLTSNTLEGQ